MFDDRAWRRAVTGYQGTSVRKCTLRGGGPRSRPAVFELVWLCG